MPKGLSRWKFLMTQSEIEPATLRFVAQCLNQLRHLAPNVLFAVYCSVLRSWSLDPNQSHAGDIVPSVPVSLCPLYIFLAHLGLYIPGTVFSAGVLAPYSATLCIPLCEVPALDDQRIAVRFPACFLRNVQTVSGTPPACS